MSVCMYACININVIVGRKYNIIVTVSDEFTYKCLLFSSLYVYLYDYIQEAYINFMFRI